MSGQEDEVTKLKRLLEEQAKKFEEEKKRNEEQTKKIIEEEKKKVEEERKKNEELRKIIEEERKKNKDKGMKNEEPEEKRRKLQTESEESITEDSPEPKKNKKSQKDKSKEGDWTRQPPTAHKGAEFEIELIGLLFLRCLRLYNSFLLTAHIKEFNPFEDILLEYKVNEECYTYLMQLKHKKEEKTLKHKNLHIKKEILDLKQHSKGYDNLKANDKETVTKLFKNEFTNWNFVLFSNCELRDNNTKPDSITEDHVLYFEGGTVHRIENITCQREPCKNKDCEFLQKIRLFMKQPNTDLLFCLMKMEIEENHSKDFVHYIAMDFTRNIGIWYENEKTNHLNENSRNIIHDVLDVKSDGEVETDKLSYNVQGEEKVAEV